MIIWQERKENLDEMVMLRKERSGLPVNLYLDDSMSYKRVGHARQIKFQPDKANHPKTNQMVPMSIEDDLKIIEPVKLKLSAQDIEKVKAFVKANKYLLIQLSDVKIDIVEFITRMVKI
jgi:hypothetical protein